MKLSKPAVPVHARRKTCFASFPFPSLTPQPTPHDNPIPDPHPTVPFPCSSLSLFFPEIDGQTELSRIIGLA